MTEYTGGGNHRDTNWTKVWYRTDDEGWDINGVEYCIAQLYNDKRFWAIPAHNSDEDECEDIGPFENVEHAAVALTLMQ